jgi:hypothetical protein
MAAPDGGRATVAAAGAATRPPPAPPRSFLLLARARLALVFGQRWMCSRGRGARQALQPAVAGPRRTGPLPFFWIPFVRAKQAACIYGLSLGMVTRVHAMAWRPRGRAAAAAAAERVAAGARGGGRALARRGAHPGAVCLSSYSHAHHQ